jgi:hypothetical protein
MRVHHTTQMASFDRHRLSIGARESGLALVIEMYWNLMITKIAIKETKGVFP